MYDNEKYSYANTKLTHANVQQKYREKSCKSNKIFSSAFCTATPRFFYVVHLTREPWTYLDALRLQISINRQIIHVYPHVNMLERNWRDIP